MKLRTFIKKFSTDEACRAHLESVRWPEGPVCDRCGTVNEATAVAGRAGFWQCRPCGKQFSVTAGTPMHGTHLPLSVWFAAIHALGARGDALSSVKLGERLSLKQKTAWSLAKRIKAMADGGDALTASVAATPDRPEAIGQEELLRLLSYDPGTGVFTWIGRADKGLAGKVAGCPNKKGYLRITVNRKSYYAHRLAFLYMTGAFPEKVDHKDRDTANNRWSNSRAATETQNHANSPKRARVGMTSSYKGVFWHQRARKWCASISVGGKNRPLGYFGSENEAHEAYAAAARYHFGEFANLA